MAETSKQHSSEVTAVDAQSVRLNHRNQIVLASVCPPTPGGGGGARPGHGGRALQRERPLYSALLTRRLSAEGGLRGAGKRGTCRVVADLHSCYSPRTPSFCKYLLNTPHERTALGRVLGEAPEVGSDTDTVTEMLMVRGVGHRDPAERGAPAQCNAQSAQGNAFGSVKQV